MRGDMSVTRSELSASLTVQFRILETGHFNHETSIRGKAYNHSDLLLYASVVITV